MSIFGSIMSKIFGTHAASAAPATAGAQTGGATQTAASSAATPTGSVPASATAATQTVDVEAVLSDLASRNSQQLNWRTSIVDLMKLLDLDSSLKSRTSLHRNCIITGIWITRRQ